MRKLIAFLLIFAASRLVAEPIVSESKFVDVDHLRVHYTNYGKGDTALFFVHGWSCDETVWAEQAPALAEKIRVITIDLPGHGQSEKPQTIEYNKDLYVRAIDAVMSDASVKSVILVGHSNGTPFVRHYYRKFPGKVKALVVVEGPLRPFFDRDAMEKFLVPLKGDNYPEAAGRVIDGMTKPIKDASLRDKIKTLMLKTPQHVAVSEFEATADPDLWKEDKIGVPVLVILAKQPVWTAEYEQFVRRLAPKVDYQVWENVSHFLMMEKPREFNAAVLKFLEQNRLD
ncbi:MAG TPA: alpha/beta hydrolase [Chthoniobacterales bacterium]|nr:alpha/beta hydrolase [Chthoniobacterales bacterium]